MAVFGVYGKVKIKIFIWENVLGTRRSFGQFRKPKISPGTKGPPSGNNVIPELRWNRVKRPLNKRWRWNKTKSPLVMFLIFPVILYSFCFLFFGYFFHLFLNLKIFTSVSYIFNPIPGGGGHYGPDDRKQSAVSTGFGLGSPKFMTLFLSMSDKTQ